MRVEGNLVDSGNCDRDPKKRCVYVGMTGLAPEERFANHKTRLKDAPLVKRDGIQLLLEFYEHLNPMPFEAAAQMDRCHYIHVSRSIRVTGHI